MTWNAEQPVTPASQNTTAELPAPGSAAASHVSPGTSSLETRSVEPDDTGTDPPRSTSAPETAGGNNQDTDGSLGDRDDAIAEQLVAWDEALAKGELPRAPAGDADSESGVRLAKGLACLKMLRRMRGAARGRGELTARGSGSTTWGVRRAEDRPGESGRPVHAGRLGRFEIRCELGRGGYGVVFLAYDPQLRREVALKVPRAETLIELGLRARFEHEARAAAGLQHPHIVQVFEAGDVGLVCYIASAYCPGVNLADWLRQRRDPVPYRDAARLVAVLADAVDHAHERGVLHRDLKPANVILQHRSWSESASRAGESWKSGNLPELSECDPVITDFGLALTEHDQSRCTITGTILGTPNYMAPEQAGGNREQQSRPTDLYALGAMFYELLTGRVPFQGDSPLETMRQVLHVEPVPPARLRPSIPRDLDTICLKCLQKDPQKRYLTARELSDDLHRYLQGEPIHARPVSLAERGWRWCRRHPLDASLTGLLALAVTAGLIGMSWMWRQAEQGRRSTTQALRQVSDANQQLQRAHVDLMAQRDRGRMLSYLHDVLLAHHECLASNPLRASQLLDDCPAELRNWEWNYLWRLSHAELQSYEGHDSAATSVVYSPDGRLLASSSGLWGIAVPGELRVAETATGKPLYEVKARLGSIMGLAFSPDGFILAAAEVSWHPHQAGNVRFFDARTGRELREITEAGSVFSLSYSPDGRRLVLGAADGRVRIVDAATGHITRTLRGHRGNVFHVAFHPDGQRVASASRDGTVRVCDASTGACLRVLDNLDNDARRVAFTPDGRVLIAASHSGLIRLWDLQRDRELTHHRTRPQGISNLGLSPDGRWLAVAYRPSGLEIWDALSGRHQRSFAAHAGSPSAAAFSPDATRLASCGVDGTVREWDLTTPIEPETIRVQASFISDVAAIPGTQLLALTSTRNTASGNLGAGDFSCRIWDPVQQQTVRQLEGHQDWLTRVVASSDGRWLATGSNDRTARLWNVADGKCAQLLSGHAATVTALCFLGQDERLVTGCEDGSVRVWKVADGKLVKSWRAHQGAVSSIVSHGSWIVSAGAQQVRVWDAERGVERALLAGHSAPVLSVAMSRDGHWLATGGADRTVFVWNFSTVTAAPGRVSPWRKLAGHNGPVNDVVFLGDGSRVASVSDDDDIVRLWDLESGQETLRVASLERARVQLAFSNDDHHLYVAGRSHVRIYHADPPPSDPVKRLRTPEQDPITWDDRQALAAESDHRWYAAAWHLDRMLSTQPEHGAWLQRRARAHAEIGQWQEALKDLQKVGQLSGKPDYWCLAQQALAHVGSGHADDYYRVCQELMARYGSTRDPAMANNVAFVASVLTPSESDLPWLLDLAEFSYVYASRDAGRYTAANTFATVLYRAGRYQDAIDSALNGIESQGAGGGFSDWLLLAMSYQALGDEAEARRWLDPALRAVREDPDLVSLSAIAAKSPWYDRVLHAVLYQEAVERMDGLMANELQRLAAPETQ